MAQDVWQEIRDKVEGLGLKLKLHLEQEADEGDRSAEANETRAALEEMGEKLQDVLNSFGNAAKDPAVRTDMRDIGVLLRDAIADSVSNVAGEAERVLKKTKGEVEDEAKTQAEGGEQSQAGGEQSQAAGGEEPQTEADDEV